jgi:hypothetical protein
LWWEGPEWAKKEKDQWPRKKFDIRPNKQPERRNTQREGSGAVFAVEVKRKEESKQWEKGKAWRLDPRRFSDWSWYVRVFARVRRVIYNMGNPGQRRTDRDLTNDEIDEADEEVWRLAQQEGFSGDYDLIKRGKPLPANSPLIKLNPRLDESGVIRSDGRLKYAEQLPYEVCHPVILPRGHWITKLIVKYYHERANHNAGVNFILAQINERYWIIAGREEIREWEN